MYIGNTVYNMILTLTNFQRWPSPEAEKKQKSPEYAHLSFLKSHLSEILGLFAEPGELRETIETHTHTPHTHSHTYTHTHTHTHTHKHTHTHTHTPHTHTLTVNSPVNTFVTHCAELASSPKALPLLFALQFLIHMKCM